MERRRAAIRKLIHFFCIGALCAASMSLHAQTAGTPVLAFVRITNGTSGEPSNGFSSRPAMSATGRFVAFESDATNLVSGDTNAWRDIFVYDCAARLLTRDSLGPGGVEGNANSYIPSISADGRYVAFGSNATNLITGMTFPPNQSAHIYLRDRGLQTTALIDRPLNGIFDGGGSFDPVISDNGRFVAFMSTSSDLVADDTNGCPDIFVTDTITGVIERASVATGVDVCDGASGSFHPSINSDGRYVAFDGEYLDPTSANGRNRGIWVRDRVAGVTSLASVASDGAKLPGASFPSIGGDGRLLSWDFRFGGRSGTYVRDRVAGVTDILSVEASFTPRVSHDAPYVSFVASGLAPHAAFVLDTSTRTLVPLGPEGADILEISAVGGNAFAVTTKVALVPEPANNVADIYVATVAAAGAPGAPRSLTSSVSGNTLTLSWAPPANGGAPSTYVVAAGSQPGRDNDAIVSTGSTATSWSATVSNTGTFYIRVHARNAAGTSPPSNETAASFGSGIRPPSDLVATVDGSTVTLTWSFPPLGSASFNSFVIEAGSSSGASNLARITVGNFSTSYVATGVAAGTYFVRVRSSNGTAVSEPSNEIVVVVR